MRTSRRLAAAMSVPLRRHGIAPVAGHPHPRGTETAVGIVHASLALALCIGLAMAPATRGEADTASGAPARIDSVAMLAGDPVDGAPRSGTQTARALPAGEAAPRSRDAATGTDRPTPGSCVIRTRRGGDPVVVPFACTR